MSMHKKPLTPLEEEGLRKHGLAIGTPSQLSDVFRHGVAWALSQQAAQPVAPVPMPGGIRLTVVERCELIDWRDKCVNDAVSRTLAAAQPQQAAECAQCATPHFCKRDGCFAKRVRAMMPLTAPVLMQDEPDGGRLSKALAGKPDAMQRAREAAAALNGASVLTDAEIGIATQYIAPASPTELHDYDLRVARAIEAAVIAKLGGAA